MWGFGVKLVAYGERNIGMTKISEIGEFGLIQRIAPLFAPLTGEGQKGIGDDCAVIPLDAQNSFLVTTDLLIEDVHFIKDQINPFELGLKALGVNLSDVAAMGGQAVSTFLSIGLPANTDLAWADAFFEGYHQLSQQEGVALLGGDTTRSTDKIVINVTVIGKSENQFIKYRSTAQAGDCICVTDPLGDSAAGLQVLLDGISREGLAEVLVERHHRPQPKLGEGQWLGRQQEVHAMMDISDGIASDLPHILKLSQVGACIDLDQIPLSDEIRQVAAINGWDAKQLAVTGGEDYSLLLTLSQAAYSRLAAEFLKVFKKPLTKIGTITAQMGLIYQQAGKTIQAPESRYRHFKK